MQPNAPAEDNLIVVEIDFNVLYIYINAVAICIYFFHDRIIFIICSQFLLQFFSSIFVHILAKLILLHVV